MNPKLHEHASPLTPLDFTVKTLLHQASHLLPNPLRQLYPFYGGAFLFPVSPSARLLD
jgi:hypothetical protein